MDHKAFAFDWRAFQRHLAPILYEALNSNSVTGLARFIEHHRQSLTDPFEGEPLPDDWSSLKERRHVQDYGDFALTLYYLPTADFGVGDLWLDLSEESSLAQALLGVPFGPAENVFHPGGMGSYFQTPDDVSSSLGVQSADNRPEVTNFIDLLERCGVEGTGIYVTL